MLEVTEPPHALCSSIPRNRTIRHALTSPSTHSHQLVELFSLDGSLCAGVWRLLAVIEIVASFSVNNKCILVLVLDINSLHVYV